MRHDRGNILFLILLAVVLFAALSYAVTSSMRGGALEGIPKEKAASLAALIMQNANMIEQQIMRVRTVDGVPEWGFDLKGTNTTSSTNATCTAANCRIFSDQGGTIPSLTLPDWAFLPPTSYGTTNQFRIVQIVNVGTAAPELTYTFHHLRKEVCDAINSALGLTTALSPQEYYNGTSTIFYSGTMTSFPGTDQILGEENTSLAGRTTFCFSHPTAGYVFVHTIIAR